MSSSNTSQNKYVFADYCFLEVEPPYIEDGIKRCLGRDVDALTIVPYFLYPGRKVKAAVTDVMRLQETTRVKFVVTRPMSMHQTLVDIVNNRITSALEEIENTLPKSEVDIMIIGHGSRDPNAGLSLDYIMKGLENTYRKVSRCWLEIEKPDIFDGVKKCEKDKPKVLVVVFYFLHEGAHVKTDINNDLMPALQKSSLGKVCITKHLGADQKIIDLILERAREVDE